MKTFGSLFTNPWFIFAIVLYVISLLVLSRRTEFSISDTLTELLIFGIGFPILAWWATKCAKPLPIKVHATGGEMLAVVAYVLALSIYLAFGPQAIDSWLPQDWIASDRIRFFITLSKKLLVFVVLPLAIFGLIWGYSVRDFGFQRDGLRELGRTHLPIVLIASCAVLAFNYFFGGAAAPLREGKLSTSQLLAGIPLCFIWLTIEAGLVEEFFFRAFLQSRLSAWFRSEITGVVLMALIFGLAHAPGFIFRHAGAVEGLGANPTALDAVAYSITTLAISGVFFGVIWARTKNLFALVLVHAATDLFPNLSDFVKTWGL
jgi:membrane protease YdiL (CAAX protease family)